MSESDEIKAQEQRCAIVLALLCLALTACGPSQRSSSRAMSGVAFVGTFSPLERARTEQALALHRSRFEARYGPLGGIATEAHAGALLPTGNVAEAIVGDRPGFRIAVGPDQDCAGATLVRLRPHEGAARQGRYGCSLGPQRVGGCGDEDAEPEAPFDDARDISVAHVAGAPSGVGGAHGGVARGAHFGRRALRCHRRKSESLAVSANL